MSQRKLLTNKNLRKEISAMLSEFLIHHIDCYYVIGIFDTFNNNFYLKSNIHKMFGRHVCGV